MKHGEMMKDETQMDPLDAARELISCFRWDLEGAIVNGRQDETKVRLARPVPEGALVAVVCALRRFIDEEVASLDVAFGGSTALRRRKENREAERRRVKRLVKDYRSKGKPKERGQGVSPLDYGIEKTAEMLGEKRSWVEDLYTGER